MKKVCVIGYGAIGPVHCEGILNSEKAQLYAVCDIDKSRADMAGEKYGVKVYYSFDEVMADSEVDSVHICVPHYLHYEMIAKACAAGKSVVAEKPVTMKPGEFDALLKSCADSDVCVMFQNRTNDCIDYLKNRILSGECGKLVCARAFLTWKRDMSYYGADNWHGTLKYEGGGVLINQSIHMLDMLTYLCGDVKSVQANMSNRTLPEIEVEDTMEGHLEFENGSRGVFYATTGFGVDSPFFVELVFEKETCRYMDGKLYINGEVVCDDTGKLHGKAYWGSGHEKVIKAFYGGDEYTNLASATNTMKTMFAMYESAKSNGTKVEIK